MNIVILGAGALGTVMGAHLAKADEDVTLITRGLPIAYQPVEAAFRYKVTQLLLSICTGRHDKYNGRHKQKNISSPEVFCLIHCSLLLIIKGFHSACLDTLLSLLFYY